jgi:hypothetical protein
MKDWNPHYIDYKKGIVVYYEKSWYCNTNKIIHKTEKEYLKCKYCNVVDNTKQ